MTNERAPTLASIIGQRRAIDLLRSALASGRLHHAWIFSGPPGIGKFTTALALSAILLDPDLAPDLAGIIDADPDSRTARLIASGTHPDLHIITKELASNSSSASVRNAKQRSIPIDIIREFMVGGDVDNKFFDSAAWKAAQLGHNKVFIIDEAELLNHHSQNAVLKTLEEPPPGTYIILITASESDLLATIRSRAQRIAFAPLSDEDINAWLDRAAPDLDTDTRAWVLRFAQGSPGRAQLALDTGIPAWATKLDPVLDALESGRFEADAGAVMARLINEWAESWVKAHANASKEAANHAAAAHLFSIISDRARLRLRRSIDRNPHDTEPALQTIDAIAHAQRRLDANANMGLALDLLAAQLAHR